MRVILECSLCERCNKFYKQKNVTGDYTPYCKDIRCTFRDTLIDNIRKSYSGNKQSDNLKITNTNKDKEIYDNTYNYFMSLTLEEQHKYINDNLDLRYYKDELLYDNKQSTARQVARRAVKYNKEFTNRYKVY